MAEILNSGRLAVRDLGPNSKTPSLKMQLLRNAGKLAVLGLFLTACSSDTVTMHRTTSTKPTPVSHDLSSTNKTSNHSEVEYFGANSFENYHNASGIGPFIMIGQHVTAECLIYDPNTTVTSTRGLWYRLVGPRSQHGGRLYVAANTFANELPGDPPDLQRSYDPDLRLCSDSPSSDLPPDHH